LAAVAILGQAADRGAALKSQPRLSPPALGLLLGLVTGIADWIILANNWSHSQSGMWYLPPFVWAAVVGTSVTLGCLAGIAFSSPRLGRLRGVAMVFAAPGMLLLIRGATLLREKTVLSTASIALLWLVVTSILAIPIAYLPMKRSRSLTGWLAGVIVSAIVLSVLAAGLDFGAWRATRVTTAGQKNVALIFLDTTRDDDALGSEQPAMPRLAAFARGAMSFDSAWAPAPWTVPSHFAVLTGVDYWTLPPLEVTPPGFQYQGPTLAQRFRSRGYETAAILANAMLGNPDFSRGYDRFAYSRASGVCRSFVGELLSRSLVHGGPRSPICGALIAPEITARALQFVQHASRPYFLTVNYLDAHYPYYVPPECRGQSFRPMGGAERESYRRSTAASPASASVLRRAHEQYLNAMRCMDRSLGTLLAALERDPNTIVVVAGDHGEQFGEHGLVEHGNSLYRQVLHVPLVLRVPGRPASHVAAPVSLTDLYPSILRAASESRSPSGLPVAEDGMRRPVLSTYSAQVEGRAEAGFSVVRCDYH
jgi:Sulfatase